MKRLVVLLVLAAAFSAAASSHLSWSHEYSPGLSPPSYEAKKAHDQAKYYARKAHDLARLRSKLYGLGHGLYGFRYGSYFPHHFKSFPLLPFVDKYPLFDFGNSPFYPFSSYFPHKFEPFFLDSDLSFSSPVSPISYGPQFPYHKPFYMPGISGHLTGFRYPNSHQNSYSKSYSYGSGYSYGQKNSYGIDSKPYAYGYSGAHVPILPQYAYKKSYPGETMVYKSEDKPHSRGYQYMYVKETPGYSISSPVQDFKLDSFHGPQGPRVIGPIGGKSFKEESEKTVVFDSRDLHHSGPYQLEPVEKILVTREHGGHSYIPDVVSGYDLEDQLDGYSVGDHHGPPLHSGLIAYGSAKSEAKQNKKSR